MHSPQPDVPVPALPEGHPGPVSGGPAFPQSRAEPPVTSQRQLATRCPRCHQNPGAYLSLMLHLFPLWYLCNLQAAPLAATSCISKAIEDSTADGTTDPTRRVVTPQTLPRGVHVASLGYSSTATSVIAGVAALGAVPPSVWLAAIARGRTCSRSSSECDSLLCPYGRNFRPNHALCYHSA